MTARSGNNPTGVLLTYTQVMEKYNIGKTTARRIAAEAGAVYKIGRSARVNDGILRDYIENNFKVMGETH